MIFQIKSFILGLLLIFCFSSYSQSNYLGAAFRGGQHNITNTYLETKSSFKFGGGLNYLMKFENNLRFSGGIYFNQRGFVNEMPLVDDLGQFTAYADFNFSYDYFSVPLLLGYTFNFNKFGVYGNIGASPMFLFNSYFTYNNNKSYQNSSTTKPIDVSAIINIGAEYNLTEHFLLGADVNFSKGFISISDALFSPYNDAKHFGHYIELCLRYKL